MIKFTLTAGLLLLPHLANAQISNAMHNIATSECSRFDLAISASPEDLRGPNAEMFISMQMFFYGMIEGAAIDLPTRQRLSLYTDVQQLCKDNPNQSFIEALSDAKANAN